MSRSLSLLRAAPRGWRVRWGVACVGAALLAACGSSTSGVASAPTTGVTQVSPSATVSTGSGTAGRIPLAGFGEITLVVTTADGRTLVWCVLAADTPALQEQGLMNVTDPTLGGYDGMAFLWESDSDGSFWMKNTVLPLSIAFVAADGRLVSTADMEPCPAGTVSCPLYPAAGRYRLALEVPQGRLEALGITPGATVRRGSGGCPAPGTTGEVPGGGA